VKPWLYRYSVVAAAFTLLAVVSGAWLTSTKAIPAAPAAIDKIHLGLASLAAALLMGLALWLVFARLRALGGTILAVVVAEAGLGHTTAGTAHAVLAHILFALAASAVLRTSKQWEAGPDLVLDQGWPSLRSMAVAAPVVVLAQVMLGAAFRHKAMGLTWHIVGAMVVALTILILGMCVMQAYPRHRALRPASIALLSVALTQVLLGITAVTTEILAPDNAVPTSVVVSTVAHVTVGAATLAASLALAIQIRRNVQKPAEEVEGERAASA